MAEFTGGAGLWLLRGTGDAREITAYVKQFRWYESMLHGGWTWELNFETNDWEEWAAVLVGRDEDPILHIRLDSREGEQTFTTGFRRAYIDSSRSAVKGQTIICQMTGADKRLEMLQISRTRAWLKTKVSDVVRRIATEHALVGKVENTAAVRDRWQLRKSDWDFLRSLTYEGASASRRGDTYLWLTGDVINYRAPELAAPSERRHNLDAEEVRVNSTVVSYNGRAIDRAGGATLLGVGYDLELGTALPFLMNAAATATQPALGRFVPRAPAKGTRTIPVFRSSLDLVEEMVRSKWGNYSPRYFSLVLETRPDLSLRPGSIVEVQATVGIKQRLPVFGRYVVLEVMHNMVKADLRTTVVCYRREAFLGADLALGASVSEGKTRDRNQTGQETPKVLIVAEVLDG